MKVKFDDGDRISIKDAERKPLDQILLSSLFYYPVFCHHLPV